MVNIPITVRGHGYGLLLQQAGFLALNLDLREGENGTLERGFWLEMMEKYYHKLLSPPWAAAGVIYELVYGLRHAGVIACSSAVQRRLQPASAEGGGSAAVQSHSWEETLLTPKRPTLGSSSRITYWHSSHSSHAVTEVTEVALASDR